MSLEETKSEFDFTGGTMIVLKCGVPDRKSVENAADKIMEKFSGIDCLINGAGGNNPRAAFSGV